MVKKNIKDEQDSENQEKIEELTNNWKRALADYQNLQRRCEQEKAEFVLYAGSSLILKLLSSLDCLEKAQAHLKDEGLDLAIGEFKNILSEEGLEEIGVQGKEFNPVEMEAVETAQGEKGKVVEVLSKGYKLKNKVIRPAKVKVGRE